MLLLHKLILGVIVSVIQKNCNQKKNLNSLFVLPYLILKSLQSMLLVPKIYKATKYSVIHYIVNMEKSGP